MTKNLEATAWLEARFDWFTTNWRTLRPDRRPGPSSIRPMIELIPALDACEPMRVVPSDYADPERWWL